MYHIIRTNSENTDFIALTQLLDAELKVRDGEEHAFFAQFNKIDAIKYTIVVYEDEKAIGCGAIKHYETGIMEVKRMFVSLEYRGKGVASAVLRELETWATELEYTKCILETGYNQPEALQLYKKNQYEIIPNYGQYENIENSVCFAKVLK